MSTMRRKRIFILFAFVPIVAFIIYWIEYTNYSCSITGGVLSASEINSCETVDPFLTESTLCNSNICTYSGSMKLFIGDITISVICPFKPLGLIVCGYIMGIFEIGILITSVILANKKSKWMGMLRIWNTIYSGIIASLATAAVCYNHDTGVSSAVSLESSQTHQILLLVMMYLICLFSLGLSFEAFSQDKEIAVFQTKLQSPQIIQMTFEDMNNSSTIKKPINYDNQHENLANAYLSS